MKNKHLLILMILILSTLSVVGGGVLRWLFGGKIKNFVTKMPFLKNVHF